MIIWYFFGFAMAAAIGWLASIVHASGRAPLGLTSMAFGSMLGFAMIGIAAGLEIGDKRRLAIGMILLGMFTVAAEHTCLYGDYRRQWQQAIAAKPLAALFRQEPPSAVEYFSHELTPESAALWSLDALLIIVSATGTVILWWKPSSSNLNPQSEIRNPKSPRRPTPDT
jgi:hypothetical protein